MEWHRNEGAGKREILEKTRRPTASSGTIPTCKNPVTRPGIESGSPWLEASGLTAQPSPWPLTSRKNIAHVRSASCNGVVGCSVAGRYWSQLRVARCRLPQGRVRLFAAALTIAANDPATCKPLALALAILGRERKLPCARSSLVRTSPHVQLPLMFHYGISSKLGCVAVFCVGNDSCYSRAASRVLPLACPYTIWMRGCLLCRERFVLQSCYLACVAVSMPVHDMDARAASRVLPLACPYTIWMRGCLLCGERFVLQSCCLACVAVSMPVHDMDAWLSSVWGTIRVTDVLPRSCCLACVAISTPVHDTDAWLSSVWGTIRVTVVLPRVRAASRVLPLACPYTIWMRGCLLCGERFVLQSCCLACVAVSMPVHDMDAWLSSVWGTIRVTVVLPRSCCLACVAVSTAVHDMDAWLSSVWGTIRVTVVLPRVRAASRVLPLARPCTTWMRGCLLCGELFVLQSCCLACVAVSTPVHDMDAWLSSVWGTIRVTVVLPRVRAASRVLPLARPCTTWVSVTTPLEDVREAMTTASIPATKLGSVGMHGRGKRQVPEETRRPTASHGTISTCENPGVTQPGIEPGSPRWEAGSLTAQPQRLRVKLVPCALDVCNGLPSKLCLKCALVRGTDHTLPPTRIQTYKLGRTSLLVDTTPRLLVSDEVDQKVRNGEEIPVTAIPAHRSKGRSRRLTFFCDGGSFDELHASRPSGMPAGLEVWAPRGCCGPRKLGLPSSTLYVTLTTAVSYIPWPCSKGTSSAFAWNDLGKPRIRADVLPNASAKVCHCSTSPPLAISPTSHTRNNGLSLAKEANSVLCIAVHRAARGRHVRTPSCHVSADCCRDHLKLETPPRPDLFPVVGCSRIKRAHFPIAEVRFLKTGCEGMSNAYPNAAGLAGDRACSSPRGPGWDTRHPRVGYKPVRKVDVVCAAARCHTCKFPEDERASAVWRSFNGGRGMDGGEVTRAERPAPRRNCLQLGRARISPV
ncbi:hypothetical protein PR048_027977 [Dryococelus australis]|uniref:Uncharacterized protein n=1 Tax=Dryococelus australis TaxID=614101 RepID=A0ABQ9GHY9_9NEOP|nr:hypothetical protein PR048_027977 [Dryococelus australis]